MYAGVWRGARRQQCAGSGGLAGASWRSSGALQHRIAALLQLVHQGHVACRSGQVGRRCRRWVGEQGWRQRGRSRARAAAITASCNASRCRAGAATTRATAAPNQPTATLKAPPPPTRGDDAPLLHDVHLVGADVVQQALRGVERQEGETGGEVRQWEGAVGGCKLRPVATAAAEQRMQLPAQQQWHTQKRLPQPQPQPPSSSKPRRPTL